MRQPLSTLYSLPFKKCLSSILFPFYYRGMHFLRVSLISFLHDVPRWWIVLIVDPSVDKTEAAINSSPGAVGPTWRLLKKCGIINLWNACLTPNQCTPRFTGSPSLKMEQKTGFLCSEGGGASRPWAVAAQCERFFFLHNMSVCAPRKDKKWNRAVRVFSRFPMCGKVMIPSSGELTAANNKS